MKQSKLTAIYLKLITFLCFYNDAVPIVDSANILFFHTFVTASHRTSIWPLAEKLADTGHNVTYIFPISNRPGYHPRIEELAPASLLAAVDNFVGDLDINIRLNHTVNDWLKGVFVKSIEFCDAFYDSPNIQQWLSRPGLHYDLVLVDGGFSQCGFGLVYKFRAKHIIFNPITRPSHWDTFGIVPETSSIPEFMFNRNPNDMNSLWSRTLTTLAPLIWRYNFIKMLRVMEKISREKLNLPDMPSFEEIEQETSLVLHNTYFIEDYPMSLPPMFVSYSGLLCSETERKARKPLSNELETFINDNKSKGFVYISFGSAVTASAMPQWLLNEFIGTFIRFPELKFLFKWTGNIPQGMPANVLLQRWFPQRDILAHPKIKAFVTQAGRPSVQEAICYGVPMIAFPIFADQDFNANRLEYIGAAISLEIASITSEVLANAIRQIINDDRYKSRLKELSNMFRDRPVDPLENAHYWVEYVLKYNTSLLKPLAMTQSWWQRRLLDVYAFLLAILLVAILIMAFLILLFVRCTIYLFRLLCKETKKRKIE